MRERRSSGDFVLDRRRASRWPLRIEVSWSFAGAEGSGTTENLTVHGCFLCTDASAPLDAEVELALELLDRGGPAKATGRVVRVARRKEDTPGFAVEFEHLDQSLRERIAALVEQARSELTQRQGT